MPVPDRARHDGDPVPGRREDGKTGRREDGKTGRRVLRQGRLHLIRMYPRSNPPEGECVPSHQHDGSGTEMTECTELDKVAGLDLIRSAVPPPLRHAGPTA